MTYQLSLQLGLRILFITVSPVVANTFTFMCPIDASDIEVSQLVQLLFMLSNVAS